MSSSSAVKRLLNYAGEKKILLILASIFSFFSTVLMVVPFGSVYFVIRELLTNANDISAIPGDRLILCGWIALGALILGFICLYIGLFFSHFAAYQILYNIRVRLSKHLSTLPLGYFTKGSSGAIKKILDSNVEKIESFTAHQIPDLVSAFLMPLIMIMTMFILDWRLAIATVIPILIGYFIQAAVFSSDSGRKAMEDYQHSLEKMSASGVEYVRGMPAVKVFGMTMDTFLHFKSTIYDFRDWAVSYTKLCRRPYMIYLVMLTSILTFILPVGVFILSGQPDNQAFALTFLLFLTVAPSLSTPMFQLMYLGGELQKITEGNRRIDAILNEKPIAEPVHPKVASSYDVRFENVSFSYQEKGDQEYKLALKNVSFTAPQGKITALVGPSGGGKSTIASLIPRFWDIEEGKIAIGGVPIQAMATNHLMETVSFVFQEVHLFHDTIEENIRMGNRNPTRQDIISAAKLACCHDFITSLPDGYDTKIGEEGVFLSGGEAQRITIARAILKNAPIIILDEATAFADPENEANIQKGLNALIQNKTVITIAHRLSTIRHADQILVLQDGEMVERGTHSDLLALNGLYKKMWNAHLSSKDWGLQEREVHHHE
ncbi:ABC transporter ATP-binding protein [Bacillus swezeyi]|uniref:ABC transporter ATP-binding protein n=1 Tax=Bacillus swezeyi TaxID=1925020 RepID=A0A5M8RP83_9BACI|nr:ABC transporter ATP-binding protein [Bacillus swezeyi]KAA6449338.1 ABC transporter ATP-binding protein [Bacillus swezeyi]TYS33355.1 ABC transporter ATP-binding protein [Bacillus swezeyi]